MSELITRIRADIDKDPYYKDNFANDGEKFLAWYLRNIYQRTAVEARQDITDGANDKEIDAVIVDDEKRRVFIFQGKFFTTTSVDGGPIQEILTAWLRIQDIPTLQEAANEKLRPKLEAVAEALKDEYEVVFELVTTGELTEAARKDFETFQNQIAEFEHPESSITLVDSATIKARWEESLAQELPKLNHKIQLQAGKYLEVEIGGVKTVLAAVPLSECIKIPGIADGRLFRKNVRQSLGLSNKVNKGLKQTIQGDTPHYFFLFHNGITALCEKLETDKTTHQVTLNGVSVVNGCQSLTTIRACSEKAKNAANTHVLFRFYEIPQKDLADKISIYTNSQSAVKARDLRSNDKRVIAIKRAYEARYPQGFFIAKRGEQRPADKSAELTVDIVDLARTLAAWHLRMPIIAGNENRLFDKHFEQLFRPDYAPEDIDALNKWSRKIDALWDVSKLNLNDQLIATPSQAKYQLLYAVQLSFCAASKQLDKIPAPSATLAAFNASAEAIVTNAAVGFENAFQSAVQEYATANKVFSPQNWLKSKDSLTKIQASVSMLINMLQNMPGGAALKTTLTLKPELFGLRWSSE
jgi:hypothetical protein